MMVKLRTVALPENFMDGATGDDRERLRSALHDAGLGLRRTGTRWEVNAKASAKPKLVELFPLMNEGTGQLRQDARHTVCERRPVASESEAVQAIQMLTQRRVNLEESGYIVRRWQQDLMTRADPMPTIEEITNHDQRLWLFRLLPTPTLLTRAVTWRMLTVAVEENITWADMRKQQRIPDTGYPNWDPLYVTQFVCLPLLARNQPLAMVFNTLRASQIIAITDEGQFERTSVMPSWPSGGAIGSLHGPGLGVYATRFQSLPLGHARELLENCVAASNRMFDFLTDPTHWVDGNGFIDISERNIAWQSLVLGTGTMIDIAEDWSQKDALWPAFQALTILEGVWGPERLSLETVLDPRILRQTVRLFPNTVYRDWAEDIVHNYEQALLNTFGGSLEHATRTLKLIRNLVHGVGSERLTRRREKLDALKGIQQAEPQMLLDIAAFWWASVLLLPESHCPPNKPSIQGATI